jgi:hypothetical protein
VAAVFSLGDSAELFRLLTDAGFQHVKIEPVSIMARYSNPEAFLAWESDVDPAKTPALQHLDAREQQSVLAAVRQDMQAALHEVIQDGQAVLASHAHVAHATK